MGRIRVRIRIRFLSLSFYRLIKPRNWQYLRMGIIPFSPHDVCLGMRDARRMMEDRGLRIEDREVKPKL